MSRIRIDELLVQREIVADLKEARARIMAGEVVAGEQRMDKAGQQVKPDISIRLRLRKPHGYGSRGGLKLAGALSHFDLGVTDCVCLDLGASTGGFTDCLLQSGASRVYAVDVAYGILDWKLQKDPRVVNLERTHAADLSANLIPDVVELVVADISFNSLARLLPSVVSLLASDAEAILLVKPQFELEPEFIGEGGIVTDPSARRLACDRVSTAVQALGWSVQGIVESSIKGTRGNIEYLLKANCF